MGREFNRNMLIMLAAIMAGVIVVTFFIADIQRQTQVDTLTYEHEVEIQGISSQNENFTDHFLQGIVKMDSARETREVGNYHFDFSLYWYNTAIPLSLPTNSSNSTLFNDTINQCIDNCTLAMNHYLISNGKFDESKPFFEEASTYTERPKYLEVLGYYVSFATSGKNITMLRYNASNYLKQAAENLSMGEMANVTMLFENFTIIQAIYEEALQEYLDDQGVIDEYLFFDEQRE